MLPHFSGVQLYFVQHKLRPACPYRSCVVLNTPDCIVGFGTTAMRLAHRELHHMLGIPHGVSSQGEMMCSQQESGRYRHTLTYCRCADSCANSPLQMNVAGPGPADEEPVMRSRMMRSMRSTQAMQVRALLGVVYNPASRVLAVRLLLYYFSMYRQLCRALLHTKHPTSLQAPHCCTALLTCSPGRPHAAGSHPGVRVPPRRAVGLAA